jgi:hypothetical protein
MKKAWSNDRRIVLFSTSLGCEFHTEGIHKFIGEESLESNQDYALQSSWNCAIYRDMVGNNVILVKTHGNIKDLPVFAVFMLENALNCMRNDDFEELRETFLNETNIFVEINMTLRTYYEVDDIVEYSINRDIVCHIDDIWSKLDSQLINCADIRMPGTIL